MVPALLALLAPIAGISRDAFGVPIVRADSALEAWRLAGRAVAEDRLWQMEMSRRMSRGRLAEVLGRGVAAADREVLRTGYTDEELDSQYQALGARTRAMVDAYVQGVNDHIHASAGTLPGGYATNGFNPEPWTAVDSMAIAVRLFQNFGRGGAGELRNMALLGYLESRPNLKGRTLDVFDDVAWQNVASSPTTVDGTKGQGPAIFPPFDRRMTIAHLARVPRLGLLELLPAIRLEERDESVLIAEDLGVPFKAGSYAVAVGKERSSTGYPLLLSAPQMGFSTPSIVHEIAIHAPGLDVAGMDVPGVPGVVIGATPDLAWGLTSGVADTDDIVFGPPESVTTRLKRTLKIKDAPAETVEQARTEDGPVVVAGAKSVFSRRSSYRGKEVASLEALSGLYAAKTSEEVFRALRPATMSFNFFFATRGGDIGYRYLGQIPLRAPGFDPRLPLPAGPEGAWRGMVAYEAMPHAVNPPGGLLTNWNNKPAPWWPNGDTPVWGEIFRVSALRAALAGKKVSAQDVEVAAWTIARKDETWPAFASLFGVGRLAGFDGWQLAGSRPAAGFGQALDLARTDLFGPALGTMVSPEFFKLVLQPSLVLRALRGKTRFDYLAGRKTSEVAAKAVAGIDWSRSYAPGAITVPGEAGIPYSNRGSYIQVVEMAPEGVFGRNVLPPGVAEAGDHRADQVPLARSWVMKPMAIQP